MTRPAAISLAGVALDPASAVPLHAQLYGALRAAILAEQLPRGARLPSTRAQTLRLSGNTVLATVERLVTEGYLEARRGAGTYIAPIAPQERSAPTGPR